MKRIISLVLALVLVFSLVACGKKNESTKEVESNKETTTETTTETNKETKSETTTEADKKPAKSTGKIEKFGLGIVVGLNANKRGENVAAQQNATFAVLGFDKDGKIVKANIDVAQSTFPVKADGKFVNPVEKAEFKTKHELKDDYGMRKASGIKKEWFEQAKAFEEYIIGKTADEVAKIPTAKKDDHHLAVPTDADLLASVTIDIGAYQKAVVKAWENAKDVKGVEKIGYKAVTTLGRNTKEAVDGKNAQVQFESNIVAVGLNANDEIVVSSIDTAQNTIEAPKDGGKPAEGTTKKTLGDKYDMKKASKIQKEWFEQIAGLEKWAEGKKLADVQKLALKDGVPTDADLLATTTIVINDYKVALEEAVKLAK